MFLFKNTWSDHNRVSGFLTAIDVSIIKHEEDKLSLQNRKAIFMISDLWIDMVSFHL